MKSTLKGRMNENPGIGGLFSPANTFLRKIFQAELSKIQVKKLPFSILPLDGHFEILVENDEKREKQQGSTLDAKIFSKISKSPKISGTVFNPPEIT